MTNRHLTIVEKANHNYSACTPDLLGCIAIGKTADEAKQNMREDIEMHILRLVEDGLPIPGPQAISDYGLVAA